MSADVPEESSAALAGFGPGSRIAGYVLEEQVGAGGMAVVFRAHDERLDRQVALKILAQAFAADQAFRQRFIRESRAAAAVKIVVADTNLNGVPGSDNLAVVNVAAAIARRIQVINVSSLPALTGN